MALAIIRALRDAGIINGEPVVLNDAVALVDKMLKEYNPAKDPSGG